MSSIFVSIPTIHATISSQSNIRSSPESLARNAFEQHLGRDLPFGTHRLSNRRQRRRQSGCQRNIVKSDDRNISGIRQPRFFDRAHRPDRRKIVACKNSCRRIGKRRANASSLRIRSLRSSSPGTSVTPLVRPVINLSSTSISVMFESLEIALQTLEMEPLPDLHR